MRLLRRFVVALLACINAPGAAALGFGDMPQSVPFGQPLDISIPLRLGAGETLTSGCLSARVELGERTLAKADVLVSAEPEATGTAPQRMRLRSAQVVDEPVLTLLVSIGCAQRLTRQFVVFADPVEMPTVAVPAAPPAPLATAQPGMPPVDAAALPAEAPDTAVASVAAIAPMAERAGAAAADPPPARPPKVAAGTSQARQQRQPRRATAPLASKPAAAVKTAAAQPNKPKAVAPAPRLRLDPEEVPDAVSIAAAERQRELDAAVGAALAAQAAAEAASQRVAGVERQLAQMREAAAADQAALIQLRERLNRERSQGLVLPLLGALVAVLMALVVWLAWRVQALQRARDAAWAGVLAAEAETAATASVAEAALDDPPRAEAPLRPPVSAPTALVGAVSAEEAAAAMAEPDDDARLTSSARRKRASAPMTRQLSVEELIDLEQQAEFFCVLGQNESAIDLLMAHLRSSGGASPMPYLKLLEIYRQREDREAYERIQKRFNQRFNAVAPDWDSDLQHGRTLLDHADVTARLQQAWPRPVDAMAELETLLFRKNSGELFELPAYRDVLVLYAVARDLDRQAEPSAEPVDVLLPLDADALAPPLPVPHMATLSADDGTLFEDRATMPVDLDLRDAPVDSRFDFLTPVSASLQRTH